MVHAEMDSRSQSPSAYAAAMEEFKEVQLSRSKAREEEHGRSSIVILVTVQSHVLNALE
jgi:hypothetical protein